MIGLAVAYAVGCVVTFTVFAWPMARAAAIGDRVRSEAVSE